MKAKDKDYYSVESDVYYQSLKTKFNIFDKKTKKNDYILNDFQEFVSTYFQHYTLDTNNNEIKLAPFHLELIEELKADKVEILAEMSRGHAKSSVFSLFAPIFFMLRGDIHLAVLISATKESSVKLLINLQVELETNQKLINDFGPFIKVGDWKKGSFTIEKYDCKFECLGKGQSVRGLRYKNYRIDYCIVDDIDTDQDCRNKETIEYQYQWLMQNVFNAMEITKYKFLFVGNRFATNMILGKFSEIPDIKHIKINALDDNGEPSWKGRFSKEDLKRIEQKIGSINFFREYMNTPINIGSIFKDEWFQFKQPLSYDKYEYIVVYLDPSFKKEADYKAVLTLGFVNKEYHILDIYLRRQTMNNVIEYLYNLNDKLLKAPYSMYYEANFAQDLHQREFNEIADKKGYKLPIIQDKDRKDNKQARIESMSVVFENRDIFISNLLEYSNDYKEFKNQMLSFPSKGVNDDGSDALQSAYVKLNLFIRKMRNDIMYGTDDRLMHF